MQFFKSLYKSCYDLLWLKSARTRGVGRAWGFFLLFTFLSTAVLAVPLAFVLPYAAKTLGTTLHEKIPEFSATIAKGELSITGFPQPFVFDTEAAGGSTNESFMVVVDTVTTSSLYLDTYLKPGQSGVLITREKAEMYQDDRGQGRSLYWNEAGDATVTKADVDRFIAKLTSTKTLVIFSLILFIFLYLGITIAKLVGLVIISLIVYLVAVLARRKVDYGDLFITGLYAVTLPTLVTAILRLLGVGFGNLYSLALLAFMLAIVFTKDGTEKVVAAMPPEPPQPPTNNP